MLKDVLRELSVSNVYSCSDIGRKLGISEALVEEAVEQLTRMGYIQEDMSSPNCEIKCSACSMSSLCNILSLKTITITKKGEKLLNHFHN